MTYKDAKMLLEIVKEEIYHIEKEMLRRKE